MRFQKGAATSYRKNNFNYYEGHEKSSAPSHKPAKVAEVFSNNLKVFVSNIPNDSDSVRSQIKDLMSQYGELLHTRYFMRRRGQNVVHLSLVVMKTESAAKKAVAAHGCVVEGRHIIVSTYGQYMHHPNCVFVTNLPCDVNEEELWQLFESKGKILFINIKSPVNLSLVNLPLQGEVIFETKNAAVEALSLDGMELRGRPISVSMNAQEEKNLDGLSVHVSGLPQDLTKDKVVRFFEQSGVVRMVKINFKNLSAVVHFTTKEAVDAALRLNGKTLDSYTLSVQRRVEVLNLSLENAVYLSNLPESVKDVDLFLAFQDCGYICEVRFLPRRTSSSKKRAIIQFQYPESIAKAIAMDGLELQGESIRVSDQEKSLSTLSEVDEESCNDASKRRQTRFIKRRSLQVEEDVAGHGGSPKWADEEGTGFPETKKMKSRLSSNC